jgi:spermidine synthase
MSQGTSPRFTFLADSKAKVDVVVGDGRLSLEREAAAGRTKQFDILALDAFNGDSLPVHLLTREAFKVYLQHLAGDESVLAIHTPTFSVDLTPVYRGLMKEFNLSGSIVYVLDLNSQVISSWVLMSHDPAMLKTPGLLHYGHPIEPDEKRSVLWTDDFSNPLPLLRFSPVPVDTYDDGRVVLPQY